MKRTGSVLLAAVFMAGSVAFAAAPENNGGDKPRKLFETKCSACHPVSRALNANKDKDGWAATVKRMRERNGCQLTDAEAKQIVEYLAKERGPKKGKE